MCITGKPILKLHADHATKTRGLKEKKNDGGKQHSKLHSETFNNQKW